jgi:hypothetical protein
MPEPRLETAVLVGKGFCSDVYAWGEGRVLKLFHGWVALDRAARKYAVTRAVHAAGVPAPAVYDLIEVQDRCGIVLERIDGVSLLEYTQVRPWSIFGAVRLMAELHAQIHRCPAPAGLPSLRERITGGSRPPVRPRRTKKPPVPASPRCRTGRRSATATSIRGTC